MRPFLEVANAADGNEVKLRDVINQLAEQFNLSDEEKSETLPSGRQSILDNRVGWARTYLTKAGLLEATRRAHFVITPRGKEALSENVDINNEYLKKFDEFIAFKQKSNDYSEAESESNILEQENISTPDEILRAAFKKVNEALAHIRRQLAWPGRDN
jgi:restriction system protein